MDADLKDLIASRGLVKAALTRFQRYVENVSDANSDLRELQERLDRATTLLDKFDHLQNQIELRMVNTAAEASQASERDSFESTYYRVVATAKNRLEGPRPNPRDTAVRSGGPGTPSPSFSEGHLGVRLPTISLPTFSGAYSEWVKFRDTFDSLIHNNDALSNIQKFHYLNSALIGDAARVIQSLGVSDSNYTLAWQSLRDRYEDSRTLIRYHVSGICDVPAVSKASYAALRQLLDEVNSHVLALKSLDEPVESWGTLLIHLISAKLDNYTKREWEKQLLSISGKPPFKALTEFLEQHCRFLERSNCEKSTTVNKPAKVFPSTRVSAHLASSQSKCPNCRGNHGLYQCTAYINLGVIERRKRANELGVCFNCLWPGHFATKCSRKRCKICNASHHTLLHKEESRASNESTCSGGNSVALTHTELTGDNKYVLLATAIVHVRDRTGKKHECRALLDPGSQSHFISEEFTRKLRLEEIPCERTVTGVGQTCSQIKHRARVNIQSRYTKYRNQLSCLIVKNITEELPNHPVSHQMPIPSNVKLADPNFQQSRKIDLLISGELFWDLLCVGQYQMGPEYPTLQKTQLGWIVGGPIHAPRTERNAAIACHATTHDPLATEIQKFWKIEEIPDNPDSQLDSFDPCEIHFKATLERNHDGRYVVSIPFNEKVHHLGDSRNIAERRFYAIERKLARTPELHKQYADFMREYEALGHMTPVANVTKNDQRCYLPHHAVMKEESTTTKLRVVFDGSAKTSSGISLNDSQHVGPTVQDDLFAILIRFRKHNVVLSADVAKMYRQILITPSQRKFQTVLWRSNPAHPVKPYELNTVTYGTASAPFLATRVLHQIGVEHAISHSTTSKVIRHDFYVDDLLTGAESVEEAKNLRQEVTSILGAAGMELRKWASNHAAVFLSQDETPASVNIALDKEPKTLGLIWRSSEDVLRFQVKPVKGEPITKRAILGEIAQIFDPLGLIGPATIIAKIMMQRLWQLGVNWDESLPQNIHGQWVEFRRQLEEIRNISIPRHASVKDAEIIDIHGFCDASEKAYGACVYLRTVDRNGQITVRLLCAKSRVAPLAKISLPRLELCGAVVLSQLCKKVRIALNGSLRREYYWCDSTVALAWINSPSNKWKTFVANRTSEIHSNSKGEWNHVMSKDNPADIISRGINPATLAQTRLWWTGPAWLEKKKEEWPRSKPPRINAPEEKTSVVTLVAVNQPSPIFNRYSSWTRLVRITAHCLRFIRAARRIRRLAEQQCRKNLTTADLDAARKILLRLAQKESFSEEVKIITGGGTLSRTSRIHNLNPFVDATGLLRVGGRLSNAHLSHDQKHPIILDNKHPATTLIIREEHHRLLHAGCQTTLASLRRQYWPIACRIAVKKVLRQCVRCFRAKPVSQDYIMGDLPGSRVTPNRAFSFCGVDYAGPFYLKTKTRSRVTIKAYVCIFVCFTTKAVHIELATDMSTEAFLNCLRRFISRRGRCIKMYSDNGSNFIGARNELEELGILLGNKSHQERIGTFMANEGMSWSLIPPHSPHFGGLWEAGVKSTKYHLKRVIGETMLTYEELYTVLVQVEACLNSRPLSPMSSDHEDLTPLTPGHFLIGEAMTALPHPDITEIPVNRLSRYQHIQFMLQHFWKRWHTEYLHQLQQRNKWKTSSPQNFGPGTLVVLKEENLPPLRWRMGRIMELHPGKDGVTRVVSVKLSNTTVKRPTSKICILPLEDEANGTNN